MGLASFGSAAKRLTSKPSATLNERRSISGSGSGTLASRWARVGTSIVRNRRQTIVYRMVGGWLGEGSTGGQLPDLFFLRLYERVELRDLAGVLALLVLAE